MLLGTTQGAELQSNQMHMVAYFFAVTGGQGRRSMPPVL